MIQVKFDHSKVPVGSDLTGVIRWHSDKNTVPKKVTLSIKWRTEGRGETDREVIETMQIDPDHFALSQGEDIPFSFAIPREGPVTYNGRLIRVLWSMTVFIDMPGVFRKDEKQDFTFNVIPRHA